MPKCIIHSRTYPLWEACPECGKDQMVKNAASELFDACKQARDTIRQVGTVKMSSTIDIIKQRLAKAERACDEAIQLALRGE